jgi:perosamine synthetase
MDAKKEKILIPPDLSIRATMKVIDEGALGIALVVDSERRLIGTVTDGDIRRATLSGTDLGVSIARIMNREPVSVSLETDMQEIRQIMLRHELKQIPVLDSNRRVLDVVLISALLRIPLSNPDITCREVQAILDVLSTSNLSLGPKMFEFEESFARYIGTRFAVSVNSGTSGLHLCIKSLGIGEGDEVITTPFSFIASSNCILFERATPVFVDIDPRTYNIDVALVEQKITPRTKAILPVHVFGHPCEIEPLEKLARKHGLFLIEDSCEAIGAEYKGRKVGSFGDCSVFSFYPNKQMTTSEGGVIVTDNAEIAGLCRSYRNQGRSDERGRVAHERIGYNYRLGELECALGIVQLERIEEMLQKREALASVYDTRLRSLKQIRVPCSVPHVKKSWFVYVVRLAEDFGGLKERDEVLRRLRADGIACSNYFAPIHLEPFYRRQFDYPERSFPVTEEVSKRTIALPFYNKMRAQDVEDVCAALERHLGEVCGCDG